MEGTYESKLGKWVDEFIAEYKKQGDNFSFPDYNGKDARDTVSWFETL